MFKKQFKWLGLMFTAIVLIFVTGCGNQGGTIRIAEELASKFHGHAMDFSRLSEAMAKADIIISSTGARDYVVIPQTVQTAVKNRRNKPLFMIDIAVPRDIDPAINDIDNVFLYDIDDLEDVVQANLAERKKEAEKLEAIIADGVLQYRNWLNPLGVVPLITGLREKALAIQEETMRSIENKLPDLTERELKVLRKHTKSIVNQLLRDPITKIKELAAESDGDEALELFAELFALEASDPKEQPASQAEQTDKCHPIEEAMRMLNLSRNTVRKSLRG